MTDEHKKLPPPIIDYLGQPLRRTYFEFWRDPVPADWAKYLIEIDAEIDRSKER